MAADKTEMQQERNVLRAQLRQAGWNLGVRTRAAGGVRVALWPVRHTGPAEGVEPRCVEGVDKMEALRTALRELEEWSF
jgi:hypothetical protein